jgi:hypothetical protein
MSPSFVRSFLNNDPSNFSVSTDTFVDHTISTLTYFGYIHVFDGRSQQSTIENMRNWLTRLALGEDKKKDG